MRLGVGGRGYGVICECESVTGLGRAAARAHVECFDSRPNSAASDLRSVCQRTRRHASVRATLRRAVLRNCSKLSYLSLWLWMQTCTRLRSGCQVGGCTSSSEMMREGLKTLM